MGLKYILRIAAVLALATACARGDAPVPIYITHAGIEMNGTLYTSSHDFMLALRRLNPKAVRFMPNRDASWADVAEALRAFQRSEVHAQTGFVGNLAPEVKQ
jgi:hypothetical protein